MPAKSNKFAFTLTIRDVVAACEIIKKNPGQYAADASRRAIATPLTSPGRYAQRRLAAGREAVITALFKIYPDELKGNYHRVTAAFRAAATPEEPNWELFNELGAQSIGLNTR